MENLAENKPIFNKIKRISLCLLILSAIFFSGCSAPTPLEDEAPVDPIIPEGSSSGLLSFFGSLSASREINDLVVVFGGQKALLAPQDNRIYLLHQDGRVLWESPLEGEPFKLAQSPAEPSFALATREGQLVFFDGSHQRSAEHYLERKIVDFALAEDGGMAAALTLPGDGPEAEEALLHLVDNRGALLWEVPVPLRAEGPYDLHVTRGGNGIAFIGRSEDGPALMWYSLKGDLRWQKAGFYRVSLSQKGDVVAGVNGPLLMVFDQWGTRKWGYDNTDVTLSHVLVSPNSQSITAYSAYSTGQDNLFYFPAKGNTLPWKARVPAQSAISLSASGEDVVVTSWQHYLEEFTLISVFDDKGRETHSLQVAGRGRKAALSPDGSTLVLCSDDGSIFFLDLKAEALADVQHTRPPTYAPVADGPLQDYVTLYFFDDTATGLIPVSRRVANGGAGLERAIEELIKGPRLGSGLSRTLPRDVGIAVEIEENTVFINLPEALASLGGSTQVRGMVDSLLYSSSHFPNVNWLHFLKEGSAGDGFEEGHFDFSRPIPVRRPGLSPGRQVLYVPVLSENRYYLTVQEVSLTATGRRDLAEKLLNKLLEDNRFFFPRDMKVRSVLLEGEGAQADFAVDPDILKQLLRDPDRSELLLDAVTLTLAENFSLDQVEILINGYKSEQTLPQLLRTVNRPFFINPE